MLDATHFGHVNALPEHISGSERAFLYRPAMNNPLSAPEIAAQLAVILQPEHIYEVRALGVFESDDPRTDIYSGLFRGHELDEMAREILRLSGRCKGIYATINPLKSVNFGYLPGTNRLKPARSTYKDKDIPQRGEIVFDFDSERDAGQENNPATNDERAGAWGRMLLAREKLTAEGLPAPTVEDSGNGFYLRYRLAPFAVVAGDDIIHRVLEAVGADTTVCNPARIMRLPGGLNVKGTATADRPYRYARILEVGSNQPVTREQLEQIAAAAPSTRAKAEKRAKQAKVADTQQAFNEWLGVVPNQTGFTRLTEQLEERASRYLDTIQPAIQGQKGSNPTLWAARVLIHGFKFSEADTLTLLERHYNPRCEPEWSIGQLQHKIADAATKPFRKAEGWALEGKPRASREYTAEELTAIGQQMKADIAAKAATLPPDAPPEIVEPCPYQASQDMREWINLSLKKCGSRSPVLFEKGSIRFVCDRDCGNGTKCRACLEKRVHHLLKMSDSYLIRTSIEANLNSPENLRIMYAAIMTVGMSCSLKKAVARRSGERMSLLTEDAGEVATLLAGDTDVSRFFPEDTDEERSNGRIGTSDDRPMWLWLLSLPSGVEPPAGFHRVSVGRAIQAAHHAAKTIPKAPEDERVYKPFHKSKFWGDKENKEPSNTKCIGPAVFRPSQVRSICHQANVMAVEVNFDGKGSQASGAGWALPPLMSAAMSLWTRGADAPEAPTVERVVELAKHWLPQLKRLVKDVADGNFVQQVLRETIWKLDLYSIDEKLKKADKEDKDRSAVAAEFGKGATD